MIKRIISLDFDGCLFNSAYCEGQLKAQERDVILHNEALLKKIIAENRALEAEAGEKGFKAECCIGSNRQSKRLDDNHAIYFGQGLYIEKGSCFPAIKKISDYLGVPLDPTLLADIFGKLPDGESYRRAMTPDYEGEHALTYLDDTKLILVYAQIHKAAMEDPTADIIYDFYDDREDILSQLKDFISTFPGLLPSNAKIRLNHYAPPTSHKLFAEIQGTGVTAEGTPFIDRNYRATVQRMVALCHPRTYFEELCVTNIHLIADTHAERVFRDGADERRKLSSNELHGLLKNPLYKIEYMELLNKSLFELLDTRSVRELSSTEESAPEPSPPVGMGLGAAAAAAALEKAPVPSATGNQFFIQLLPIDSSALAARRRKVKAPVEQSPLDAPGLLRK